MQWAASHGSIPDADRIERGYPPSRRACSPSTASTVATREQLVGNRPLEQDEIDALAARIDAEREGAAPTRSDRSTIRPSASSVCSDSGARRLVAPTSRVNSPAFGYLTSRTIAGSSRWALPSVNPHILHSRLSLASAAVMLGWMLVSGPGPRPGGQHDERNASRALREGATVAALRSVRCAPRRQSAVCASLGKCNPTSTTAPARVPDWPSSAHPRSSA